MSIRSNISGLSAIFCIFALMKDELTAKMHSEFTVDPETEISHIVGTIVDELNDGPFSLEELLEDYGVTMEQYEKYRSEWENLIK